MKSNSRKKPIEKGSKNLRRRKWSKKSQKGEQLAPLRGIKSPFTVSLPCNWVMFVFSLQQIIVKQLLNSAFHNVENDQGFGKCQQRGPRLTTVTSLFWLFRTSRKTAYPILNRLRSMYHYSNMAPRLLKQTSMLGVVFFAIKSLLGRGESVLKAS